MDKLFPRKTRKTRNRADWQCMECGRKFRTVRAAEKASWSGCPKCGGCDIDLTV